MSNNSPIDENKFPDILDALHQEHWYVTKLLVLLIIICIASLGSLSLAQHLLPQNPLVQTTPIPKYSDGKCDSKADPDKVHYVPLLSHSGSPSTSATPPNVTATPSKTPGITPTPSTHKKYHSSNITSIGPEAGDLSINSEMAYESLSRPQAKPTQAPSPTQAPPPIPTPSPTLSSVPSSLPTNWETDGLTLDDARYVAACAATFVQTYHTYDASDPQTFENAVYMLSIQAKKTFYLGGSDPYGIHLRMLPSWQNTAESRQQVEQATVAEPIIEVLSTVAPTYTVTVRVDYNLTKQINNQYSTLLDHDTIILQNTSPAPSLPNEKIGWQVIDWQDGDE